MRHSAMLGALLLALVVATPVAAASLGIGARAGVNLANLRGDFADLAEPDTKVGVEGGFFLVYRASADLGLQLEANYVSKGAKFESEMTDGSGNPLGTIESRLELSYIEVPLLLRATFRPWGRGAVRPYLIGGPTMSIALDATFENETPLLPDIDYSDDMEQILWGVTGGLGLRFPTGPVGFALEARYRTDFSDLWDIDDNLESINRGISLTVALSR